ncbi:transporter [Chryseobacterium formosense]|uniref:Transporter n=1 Tax=Chryseobacterium formosense TaxID=236814 RepID=A0A085Z5V0_9FLAO|nr:MFS transporter [Chryseobacterium formosense]KFE99813.1 transporter [Chryseobacterium formosense]SFT69520.1 sugar (Glycoside-Pentoside-Hexuronide) transporter [Chryseobacterium formosense]
MNNSSQKISVVEKIGYSLGDLAANLVFQTLVTYLAYFYTDIYGLKPEDASIITLTVGLLAGFVFNPLIGALADRTRTKWGKFRPWILLTAIPLGAAALFAFSTPDFSYKGKMIYAAITYSVLLLLYAANNLPYAALSGVITGDMSERNSISSYRFVAVMFAQFFVQVFMLPIILSAGHGDKAAGIEVVMTWLAIIGTIMLLITFLTTKERVIPKPEQESTLRADLKDLKKNKPWIIMLTVTALIFITLAMKGGSYVYYFNNYVDEASLQQFISPITNFFNSIGMNFFGEDPRSAGFGLFNAGGIIMMIVGITFSKKFADKYGKRDAFIASLFISTLFVLAFIFYPPKSVGLMFLSQILHGFFYGIGTPLLWAMIADVADYSEWKNNRRATAIIFSAMMVGLKVGLSIGSSLVALIIGKYGYISSEGAMSVVQPESVSAGAKMLVSVFPSIPFFLACGLLMFYEINKKKEIEIEHDLKERRKAKN